MNSSASRIEQEEAIIVHYLNPEAVIEQLQLEIQSLQHKNEELQKKVLSLKSHNRGLLQLSMALGDKNRYYASQQIGRYASDNEAFFHFVFRGGKERFDETHPWG
jgi:predicted RNase H-like nuclease (RuvC/YqgF family)